LFSEYCEENNVTVDSLLSDGLHPNDKGYKVMFDLLTEALGI
jgi:lysophospholipase L1-like esterase